MMCILYIYNSTKFMVYVYSYTYAMSKTMSNFYVYTVVKLIDID
jgi:hypothetical protein